MAIRIVQVDAFTSQPFAGNPASIVLREHEEIVLAYGTRAQLPKPLPARFAFEPGL